MRIVSAISAFVQQPFALAKNILYATIAAALTTATGQIDSVTNYEFKGVK